MKKYLALMMIAALMASFSACSDDDDDPSVDPPAEKKYTVEYKLEVNENHGNAKLVYYGPSLDKKEVENPAFPWEMSYTDFKQGDSVYFQFEIFPLLNKTFDYSWSVYVTLGDSSIGGNSEAGSNIIFPDSIPPNFNPLNINWAFKIE